jgi:hypothetical protein
MSVLELLQLNLLSPVILCFFLGIGATLLRSDLRFPEELYKGISLYLLLAIGMKGGVALVAQPIGSIFLPIMAGFFLSALSPLLTYPAYRFFGKLDSANAAALAAHYGSVSVVTFLAATSFLAAIGESSEGFLPALVAIMEFPAIIIALLLVKEKSGVRKPVGESLRSVLTGKSVYLLLGGILIGALSGEAGFAKVEAFFVTPFQGVLCLFLLEMGMVASRRFPDLKRVGLSLALLGIGLPLVQALIGMSIGSASGLSRGGAFVLAVLAASASYIAAPATVRLAIPTASPALYITSSLAITFPFNLVAGIPLYYYLTGFFYN